MKQPAHIILLTLLLLSLQLSIVARADYPKAPPFQLPTQDGHIDLSSLQGKLVYVDFWASWCRPCKDSFPWMIAMKKKFKNMPFEIVAINLDNNKTLADDFLNNQAIKQTINFPVAFDPQASIAEQYGVKGMPSSFLVDPEGKMRIRYTGFWNKSKNEKEQIIQDLLIQFKLTQPKSTRPKSSQPITSQLNGLQE